MEAFRWISVAFSMILGLGVTRILSGAILVFSLAASAFATPAIIARHVAPGAPVAAEVALRIKARLAADR